MELQFHQVDRSTAIQIKRHLAGIEDDEDISAVVQNETMITKNSVKQWVDYDVSPAKCTPHVLPPSHTSAPFGLDDQPPTKEPLAFDRVYDTRFDGKDTERRSVRARSARISIIHFSLTVQHLHSLLLECYENSELTLRARTQVRHSCGKRSPLR